MVHYTAGVVFLASCYRCLKYDVDYIDLTTATSQVAGLLMYVGMLGSYAMLM